MNVSSLASRPMNTLLPVAPKRLTMDDTSASASGSGHEYIFVSPKSKTGSCLQETKRGFHTACRLAGIEGLIWKDLRATFGTRLAEIGCDAFTIAQLLGDSDVRVTMRHVKTVEESKRAAVDAGQLN